MEEKRYPKLDEEDGSILKANDASEAVAYAYDCTESKNIPGLPENWDDLLDCLKEGEDELERGESIPWDIATKNMRKHIAEYAS